MSERSSSAERTESRRRESLALLRGDVVNLSKSVTELTKQQMDMQNMLSQLKTDREVRIVEQKHMNAKLDTIISMARWVLLAFGTVIIYAVGKFLVDGGFGSNVP